MSTHWRQRHQRARRRAMDAATPVLLLAAITIVIAVLVMGCSPNTQRLYPVHPMCQDLNKDPRDCR